MALKLPIYMDNHATTPVDPRVLEAMLPYFTEHFGNASSDHIYGLKAAEAVDTAREQTAKLINAKPEEIIFTSGATEANNLALFGIADAYAEKGDHIITCVTEHKAIIDTSKRLEKMGKKVTYLPVDKYGLIDLKQLEAAITDRTILISIMTANNEIGTIQPIKEIGAIAHKHNILFHTDAAQAVGHIPVNVNTDNIDLMSFSGHKVYGPKGIGGFFIRRNTPRIKMSPSMYGGGQEKGIRSGTLNVPGILGIGKALEIARIECSKEAKHLSKLRDTLQSGLLALNDVSINGHPNYRLPHNLNIHISEIDGKALINSVKEIVTISTGSACSSNIIEASHVLLAIGLSITKAHECIRLGIGRFNTEEDIQIVINVLSQNIKKLHNII